MRDLDPPLDYYDDHWDQRYEYPPDFYDTVPYHGPRRRRCRCFRLCCCPGLGSVCFCYSVAALAHTWIWILAFAVAHGYFAGCYFTGAMSVGGMGFLFHGMMAAVYLQTIFMGENIGAGTQVASVVVFVARILWVA